MQVSEYNWLRMTICKEQKQGGGSGGGQQHIMGCEFAQRGWGRGNVS